jgi:DNA ligase (NAD+)
LRKAGDIIPEIVEVLKELRQGKEKSFRMPTKCPVCGSPVEKRPLAKDKLEAAAYCSNKKCFAQEREKLIYFAGKKGFNIEGLGEKIVGQLMEVGLIRDFSDIFRLKEGDLVSLERFADLSAKNLVTAIENSKNIKIEKFINALGIRHVGEETAILVARYLEGRLDQAGTIHPLKITATVESISIEQWQEIKGIGDKSAQSLYEYFHNKENIKQLGEMRELGVRILLSGIKKDVVSSTVISGKTFVFTGTLPNLSRDEAKEMARTLGGEISSSVSKKTDYLVTGADPGSKLEKARDLGVKVIDEAEFLLLVKK